MRFWKRTKPVDPTEALLASVNAINDRRTEMLAELAGERRRLEARLIAIDIAEASLLLGEVVQPTQPAPEQAAQPIGDTPWFPPGEESEPEQASIFAAEAVAEVREPETATTSPEPVGSVSTGARPPVEEETPTEAPAEAENGQPRRMMAEEERTRFTNYLAARSMNVPVPSR